MKHARILWLILALSWLAATGPSFSADDNLRVADGLTISLAADDDLVPDCSTIACDWNGQLVASGPGYIRRLFDADGDGVFDRFELLADDLDHGAHGLYFMQPYLYYVANNGVWRLALDDRGKRQYADAEKVLNIRTGGEHHAHALRMGPDGYWYLIAGNGTTGMQDLQNVENSQVPRPRAGMIWQISSDWTQRRVWAHGFRNAYDFDFGPDHSIITFDSDGEREVSLPWYRPTRVYRVRQGDDAGWVTRNWKYPDYDPDMPQVLAEFGRGSPTGVVRYNHHRLPARFHNGTFVLDWTFGRVLFVTDDGQTELVVEPRGTQGFAVTDIVLMKDGRLAISVGGRGSRGSIYILDALHPGPIAEPVPVAWNPQTVESIGVGKQVMRKLRTLETGDDDPFTKALQMLEDSEHEIEQIAAMKRLVELAGGLGEIRTGDPRPSEDQAVVFDSYRCRVPIRVSSEIAAQWTRCAIDILSSDTSSESVRQEAVRGLAVVQATSTAARDAVLADMLRCDDPTDQLHRVMALARMPVTHDASTTQLICDALVDIPVRVSQLGKTIDRNWTPRLVECFRALRRYVPDLDGQLVSHPRFVEAPNLVWTEALDNRHRHLAAERFLGSRSARRDSRVASFVVSTDVQVPREVIDQWLADESTRSAAWIQLAKQPQESDIAELQNAFSFSFDPQVQKMAGDALERLGIAPTPRKTSNGSADLWLQSAQRIEQLDGNPLSGQTVFTVRQCARCHNAAKALGPSLAGISKRYSHLDLLRATVDPSQTIPDRYRAMQVLTVDGQVLTGMMIYESVDGVILLTADARTVRINADAIEQKRNSSKSLMPEGLLEGASEQEVADLLAYLQEL